MSLAIFNGSPRRKKSNSSLLMEQFLVGYRASGGQDNVMVTYLAGTEDWQEPTGIFAGSDEVIIIFPLYTDAMPGLVKEFFEQLYQSPINRKPRLGFIVQSGFPEAIHSVYVERYLRKFSQRLGCEYLGTVIRGGVEGIQIMPPAMTGKLFRQFRQLGSHFAQTGTFSPGIMAKLKGPLRMPKWKFWGFKLFSKTKMANYYWNSHLKKHNAWDKRFDAPFV